MTAITSDSIIVSSDPKGHIKEMYVDGALLPGTAVEVKPATAAVNGRFTARVYTGAAADGERVLLGVLLEDSIQGKTTSDAYTSGTLGRVFFPCPGDEFLGLVADSEDTVAIGDKLILDNGTGEFLETTGTPESEPAIALEALGTIAADTLCHMMATGQ